MPTVNPEAYGAQYSQRAVYPEHLATADIITYDDFQAGRQANMEYATDAVGELLGGNELEGRRMGAYLDTIEANMANAYPEHCDQENWEDSETNRWLEVQATFNGIFRTLRRNRNPKFLELMADLRDGTTYETLINTYGGRPEAANTTRGE